MLKCIIKLTDQKQIRSFYNRLWIYKSFLFKFTNFEIESNCKDEQIQIIQDALNIKKRRKRITFIYDETCNYIDNKNKGSNICGFKDRKCFTQQCQNNNYVDGCCRKCRYKTSNGCYTKNLACKLFNCSEVTKRYDVVNFKDLKVLKLYNLKNRRIVKSDYFSKREDVLKDLYSYSLIYSSIRMVYRLIRNYIYLKMRKNS